ncbi:hypothetical protein R3W88_018787 [Solanum pinnatisectum]|uniref:Uncharacterized protein n=1 Tax=Solanum pinnatisectum TaxID=50273 RepID=A0AAV9KKF5_9SOLN|nr:hypothetical protein R3W88_018787 [Solanum pinnatisectum]
MVISFFLFFTYDFAYIICYRSIKNCILTLVVVGINLTPSPVLTYVYKIF